MSLGVEKRGEIKVWDLATRVFHWSLVLLIIAAYCTRKFLHDPTLFWHRINGYAIFSLVLFRMIWGVFGSSTARFSNFLISPNKAIEYSFALIRRRPLKYFGHNPLGAMLIFAMLAALVMQTISGLFSSDDANAQGPLAGLVPDKVVDLLSKYHVIGFWIIFGLVLIHVTANSIYQFVLKDRLITAMVTGRKPMSSFEDRPDPVFASAKRAMILAAIAPIIVIIVVLIVPASQNVWHRDREGSAIASTTDDPWNSIAPILERHCARCHQDGKLEGRYNQRGRAAHNFGYILDFDKLLANNDIVPGDPGSSRIYKVIEDGTMPAEIDAACGKLNVASTLDCGLSNPEKATISSAITRLAKLRVLTSVGGAKQDLQIRAPKEDATQASFISDRDIVRQISNDVANAGLDGKNYRYLSLLHLANAGLSTAELERGRQGLLKLVNSLSVSSDPYQLIDVGSSHILFRIDLRQVGWTAETWNKIAAADPYSVDYDDAQFQVLKHDLQTESPFVDGDWFAFAAARPPLYYEVLNLPKTKSELVAQLNLNLGKDFDQQQVERAGFQSSGVSDNNRMIERHVISTGAYWESYDFGSNSNRKNIFEFPLGPPKAFGTLSDDFGFQQDGGEIIYALPNGFHAYYLTNGRGDRLDIGPTNIVRDRNHEGTPVINGVSCMSCHTRGMRMIDYQGSQGDEIRDFVLQSASFPHPVKTAVKAIFPVRRDFQQRLETDARRYVNALEAVGLKTEGGDPVSQLSDRFEGPLNIKIAAAAFGMQETVFKNRLDALGGAAHDLKTLLDKGTKATVPRDKFVTFYTKLYASLNDNGDVLAHLMPNDQGATSAPGRVTTQPDTPNKSAPLANESSHSEAEPEAPSNGTSLPGNPGRSAAEVEAPSRASNSATDTHNVGAKPGETSKYANLVSGPDQTVTGSDAPIKDASRETGPVEDTVVKNLGPQDAPSRVSPVRKVQLPPDGYLSPAGIEDQSYILSVDFSPDGTLVLIDGEDTVLWDLRTGNARILAHHGQAEEGKISKFSPDGQRIVEVGHDIVFYDLATGHAVKSVKPKMAIQDFKILRDNKRMLLFFNSDNVAMFDTDTGKNLFEVDGQVGLPNGIALASDESLFAVAGSGLNVRNTDDGRVVQRFPVSDVRSVAFSPDGRKLVTGGPGKNATISIWDIATGAILNTWTAHTEQITSVAFDPGGALILSASDDKKLKVWDVNNGQLIREIQNPSAMEMAVLSPNGSRVLATDQATARLYDEGNGDLLATFFVSAGHGVAFTPDGRFNTDTDLQKAFRIYNASTTVALNNANIEASTWPQGMADTYWAVLHPLGLP